jgi:hypothetical protein
MKISKENKAKLIDEINFVIEKMKKEQDDKAKLYYFSAVYGVMQRIFNMEYSPDLIFANFVISSTLNNINMRLLNPDAVIKVPEGLFEKLIAATEELSGAIEKNNSLYEVLMKFTLLGYVTTGNGYYLYQKGLLKI